MPIAYHAIKNSNAINSSDIFAQNIIFLTEFQGEQANVIDLSTVQDLNEAGKIKRNLKDPPLKDTIAVPDAGFTVVRFLADNPGYWLIHTMLTWFQHMGTGVILQVEMK